jgi:elongation factor 1-gamma
LYAFPESHRALKARVAAALSGYDLQVVELATNDSTHPHVPAFETQDKRVRLFEANSIAYYVSNEQLRGGSSHEGRTQVVQWVNFGSLDLASAVASWVYPALSLVESTPQNVQRAQEDLRKLFHCLDEHLRTRTYLVGERLSLADVSVAADLLLAYQHVADEAFRRPYTNLNRWFTTVVNQNDFARLNGEVKFCVKALEFDAKRFAQNRQQQQQPKAPKPAKEAKPAVAPKPAPAKKEVEPEEEEDDLLAQEPKQTDPFATMPKG